MQPSSPPEPPSLRRQIWSLRFFFLLLTGASAFFSPFLGLFYRQHGLSGTQIGLLATVGSLTALLAAPLWGRWSDRAARPRLVLQTALALAALCIFLLSRQTVFLGFLLVVGLFAMLNAGTEPISNRLALAVAQRAGAGGFGSIRMWGSLGWALMVLLSGWLIEQTGTLQTAFIGAIVLQVFAILLVGLVAAAPAPAAPAQPATEQPADPPSTRGGAGLALKAATTLLRDRVMLGLAAALVLQWLVLSGVYQFQAIYLQQLGAGEGLIGIFWMVSAVVELPAMWYADRLIQRFGAGWLLAMGFLLEALRTVPILLWPSIPALIGAELINGLAYSFLWISMVVYVNDLAGSRRATTMQALFTVTLPALTRMAGGPLTGLVFDHLGAYWLYAFTLVGSLAAFAVLWLTNRPWKKPTT